jgi:hypothetical protein
MYTKEEKKQQQRLEFLRSIISTIGTEPFAFGFSR